MTFREAQATPDGRGLGSVRFIVLWPRGHLDQIVALLELFNTCMVLSRKAGFALRDSDDRPYVQL